MTIVYSVIKLRAGVSGEMFNARLGRGKDEADDDRHIYQRYHSVEWQEQEDIDHFCWLIPRV